MPIRGVLFDIDDTLFDSSSSRQIGVLAHLEAEGLLDWFPDKAAALKLWRDIMERHYARFLNGEISYAEQRRQRTREFLSTVGQTPSADMTDAEATAWFARYQTHRDPSRAAFPDAEPVLRKLAPDYRLGIVSNSSADHQRDKLAAIGLLPYFADMLLCSDQHGAPKPDPSIFLAGCAILDLQPDEVVYVGDRYDLDARGAQSAGLHAFWLDRTDNDANTAIADGIAVIHSLDELPTSLATRNSNLRLEYQGCGVRNRCVRRC